MTDKETIIRLGTRGSRLALQQTAMVRVALLAQHPHLSVETVVIKTSGDWSPAQGETRLPEETGGKAHFAKEIEEALLTGTIDAGVHSLKDMATTLPAGLMLRHCLPRADARDAFLANGAATPDDLPHGAIVGTASPRRQAFLLARRPDLKIVPLRGNVPTRIEKLRRHQVDATLLAVAGLERLGLGHEIASVLEPDIMLPAAGQGVIGIELRQDDTLHAALFDSIHCAVTGLCAAAERSAVAALSGTCHTPIGAYATVEGNKLSLALAIAAEDGTHILKDRRAAIITTDDEAAALGHALGTALHARQ